MSANYYKFLLIKGWLLTILFVRCNGDTSNRNFTDSGVLQINEQAITDSPNNVPARATAKKKNPSKTTISKKRSSLTQKANSTLNIKDFGAKGDGITDDTKAIQAALDAAGKAGGGKVIVPSSQGNYMVSNCVYIHSNTVMEWTGENFIKLYRSSASGSVLAMASVINPALVFCENIRIINPYIDASSITSENYGENGIGFAFCKNVEILGGVVRGAKRKNVSGGKGILFEIGVYNCTVKNTLVENSDFAYGTQGVSGKDKHGRPRVGVNIKFLNVTARNCGRFLWLTCTMSPPPVDKNITSCVVDGFKAYNCGKMDGLITVDRYSFASIKNGIVQNASSYGPIQAIIRGRGANITLDNIQFKGNTISVASSKVIPKGGVTIKAENWIIRNIQQSGDIDYISTGDVLGDWKNPKFERIQHGNLKKSLTDVNSLHLESQLKKQ